MTAKGSGNCCCGGCKIPPWNLHDDIPERGLQPMQAYCCPCVPKRLCVSYDCDGVGDQTVFRITNPCDDPELRGVIYTGEIPIDGELVTIDLFFEVVDEVCTFHLSSDRFSEPPEPLPVDETFREIMCSQCQECGEDYLEFAVVDDCAGQAVVRVRPAPLISIPPLDPCCDCPDPCADKPYADAEDRLCWEPCAGCGCICATACITVVEQGDATTYLATACDYTYSLPNGMAVSIVGNEGGCCELELDTGMIEPVAGPPGNVGIGDSLNPCPLPRGRWEFEDAAKDPFDRDVIVLFNCVSCGGCDQVTVATCCVATIPRVLTASLSGSAGCCGELELDLIYNEQSGTWTGRKRNAWCDGGEINLELGCDEMGWVLTFAAENCVDRDVIGSGICEPVSLSFLVTLEDINPGVGPWCCDDPGGGTVTVTVTE